MYPEQEVYPIDYNFRAAVSILCNYIVYSFLGIWGYLYRDELIPSHISIILMMRRKHARRGR